MKEPPVHGAKKKIEEQPQGAEDEEINVNLRGLDEAVEFEHIDTRALSLAAINSATTRYVHAQPLQRRSASKISRHRAAP
jgi:hypothetical protein